VRLSELLQCRVVDGRGEEAGNVLDVRLVQDGPAIPPFGAAFRVEGLIVGPPMAGTRLGYGRTGISGPLLLAWPLRRMRGHVRFVPWARVDEVTADLIRITGSARDLAEPETVETR
jgi:hypothetical protein